MHGNVLSMMKIIANYDSILNAHLAKPIDKRMPLTFHPKIQKEIMDIIGKEITQKSIIEENQKVAAIWRQSYILHQRTMHMHVFVVSKKSVRKEFIQFTTLIQVTGKSIAEQICDDLKFLSLNIKNIRGRGYDGAFRIGVVTTLEKSPLATL